MQSLRQLGAKARGAGGGKAFYKRPVVIVGSLLLLGGLIACWVVYKQYNDQQQQDNSMLDALSQQLQSLNAMLAGFGNALFKAPFSYEDTVQTFEGGYYNCSCTLIGVQNPNHPGIPAIADQLASPEFQCGPVHGQTVEAITQKPEAQAVCNDLGCKGDTPVNVSSAATGFFNQTCTQIHALFPQIAQAQSNVTKQQEIVGAALVVTNAMIATGTITVVGVALLSAGMIYACGARKMRGEPLLG